MKKSIQDSEEISNSLKTRDLYETLTGYAAEYVMVILLSIFSAGYRGKTVDMEQHSKRHRTSISRFLRNEEWDDSGLEDAMKALVIKTVYEESERSGKPVYCIIDDTIASKTKPSSKAKRPLELADFHYSHLKKGQDYGHQAVGVLLSCNGITLPYRMILYDKTDSKIDIAMHIAEELPTAPNLSYLLCDSWYVCGKVMDAFLSKCFYTIGGLKSNRILFPYGARRSVRELAGKLEQAQCRELFHIVTVKGRRYWVYRYEGKLNKLENAVVLLCYPVQAFGKAKALRAFISTNAALSDQQILDFYTTRWEIEVYFRNCKNRLALDKYQIRSAKGISRFWLITSLAYLIACFESQSFDFSEGFALFAHKLTVERYSALFDLATSVQDKQAFLLLVA